MSTSARSSMDNPFRHRHSSLVAACKAHTLRIVLSIMVAASLAFAVFSTHGDSKGRAQQTTLPRFCRRCIEMRFIAQRRGLCIFLGIPKFSTISISNPRDRRGEVKLGPNRRTECDAPDWTEVEWRAVGLVARLPLFGSCIAPSTITPSGPHKTKRGTVPLDRPGVSLMQPHGFSAFSAVPLRAEPVLVRVAPIAEQGAFDG